MHVYIYIYIYIYTYTHILIPTQANSNITKAATIFAPTCQLPLHEAN